jgi:hypothetical protein
LLHEANGCNKAGISFLPTITGKQKLVRHCRVIPISLIAQVLGIVAPPAFADRAHFTRTELPQVD